MDPALSVSDSETDTSRREEKGLGGCEACKYRRVGWNGMVAPYLHFQNSTRRGVGAGAHSSDIKLPHFTLRGLASVPVQLGPCGGA